MSNTVKIEANDVYQTLNKLSDDELRRSIIFKAIYAGAKRLQAHTQEYFKSSMGDSANHVSRYIKKPFFEGVTVKGDKAYLEAVVSIMKDFRMKFFEKGTQERYIKQRGHSDYSRKKIRYIKNTGKPNYRGRIKAKHFFADARKNMSYLMNSVCMESIRKNLEKILK